MVNTKVIDMNAKRRIHEIKDAIYVGVKLRNPEKFRLAGIGTLTSAIPV